MARIGSSDSGDDVSTAAESELEERAELVVTMRTLDSFDLVEVGFLNIDAEGHELAVLHGAYETITTSRPVVFVESEARHAAGAPANVIELMRERHGYRRAAFVRGWALADIDEFDLERDQLGFCLISWIRPMSRISCSDREARDRDGAPAVLINGDVRSQRLQKARSHARIAACRGGRAGSLDGPEAYDRVRSCLRQTRSAPSSRR